MTEQGNEYTRAIFELPEKISTNKFYAGMNYRKRAKIVEGFKNSIYWQVQDSKLKRIERPEDYPVCLLFKFYLKNRLLDASNCSGMGKMIEDGLVFTQILKDDSPKYVASVTYESHKARQGQKSNLCELIITKYDSYFL